MRTTGDERKETKDEINGGLTSYKTSYTTESRKCVIPFVCMKLGKWYLVKHNCIPIGVFNDCNGQLHVSACTGHLQVALVKFS